MAVDSLWINEQAADNPKVTRRLLGCAGQYFPDTGRSGRMGLGIRARMMSGGIVPWAG